MLVKICCLKSQGEFTLKFSVFQHMELCLKQLVRKILTIPRNVDAQVAAGKAVGREQPGPTAVRAAHPGTQPTPPAPQPGV